MKAGMQAVVLRLPMYGLQARRQDGQTRAGFVLLVEIQADAAVDLDDPQAHLAQMLHATLAQFHEEFVVGDVALVQRLQFEAAIPDQNERLSLKPALQVVIATQQAGSESVSDAHGNEHHQHRQDWHVVVEGHVAGCGAQGQDHHQFEQRKLFHPAAAGDLEEDEDHGIGQQGAHHDFAEEGQGVVVEEHAGPVESGHGAAGSVADIGLALCSVALVQPFMVGREG